MSPELRFVAACCRWPDDEVRKTAIKAAASEVRDWSSAIAMADAHRVQGLVAHGAGAAGLSLPDAVQEQLNERRQWVRSTALKQVGKTLQLSQALANQGVEHRVLKGVPLGVFIYGSPTLKHSWDIDLLVSPGQAVEAAQLLRGLGYEAEAPVKNFGPAEFARWAVTTKELILRSSDGSVVELHWRISDHPMLLTGLDAHAPACEIDLLGGRSVPAFPVAANLAYLAVHGAFHGWSRLKWLSDFSALLRLAEPEGLDRARTYRPGRALDQAVQLSAAILGAPVRSRSNDPVVQRLVGLGSRVIEARTPERDIESDAAAQKDIRRAQWLLLPAARYRALLALRWIRGSEDRKQIPLPKALSWAYWVIRPFTAVARASGRRMSAVNRR